MRAHENNSHWVGLVWNFCFIFILLAVLTTYSLTAQSLNIKAQSGHSELYLVAEEGSILTFGRVIFPLNYRFAMPLPLPAKNKLPYQQSIIRTDPAHAYKHLGVICKWEYRLERAVQFPVKFRLGEYHYVQKLEGKSLHNDFLP
jgi:hypothetical protein